MLMIVLNTSGEIALSWVPAELIDDKSTLV